ncbi:MAG: 2OG-Fe(II) oxygenase [Acidobacteriota bacterium]|nr:2OG-Fe(II) oxygenase [Acidobacteriota bacterium]
MIEIFEINDFLDAATREKILAEMRAGTSAAAPVYGKETSGAVDPLVRKAARVEVLPETRLLVVRMLLDSKGKFGRHFGVALNECEDPQFLHYRTGDFFVAHQDGNTPLIYDDSRFRKISVIIFLNSQSNEPLPGTYQGGDLVFHGGFPNYSDHRIAESQPGKLIAFRAETTHEVIPVSGGERFTIVSWFR